MPVIEITTLDSVEPTYRETTSGYVSTITDNEYVEGRLSVWKAGELLYESGEYEKNRNGVKIKIRGNSSAIFAENKPYKIKFEEEVDFIGIFLQNNEQRTNLNELYNKISANPANPTITEKFRFPDKEFVIIPALSTNLVGFYIARLLEMEWTPEFTFINLILNGKFRGFYMLAESVKRGTGRCNISKNGFIIEYDAYWWNEDVSFQTPIGSSYSLDDFSIGYTFKYPKKDNLTQQRVDEVSDYMNSLESFMSDPNEDISRYFDFESFSKWELIQDLVGNGDPFGSNIFLYRNDFDSGDPFSEKLKIGPIWDLDGSFRTSYNKWTLIHNQYYFGSYNDQRFLNDDKKFGEEYRRQFWKIYPYIAEVIPAIRKDYAYVQQNLIKVGFDFFKPMEKAEKWLERRVEWMRKSIWTSFPNNYEVSIFTSEGEKHAGQPFKIYVNGVDEYQLTLLQVEVIRMDGMMIKNIRLGKEDNYLSLPSGVFLLRLRHPWIKSKPCWVFVD